MHIIGVCLILIGVYGLLTNRHLIKMIVSINVLEVGLNLFIIAVGYSDNMIVPIITKQTMGATNYSDPLPQALVLTAIVIGVGTTAILLAVARKLYQQYGTFDLTEMEANQWLDQYY